MSALHRPQGLKANMTRLYQLMTETQFSRCSKPAKYKKLLFALCFFHSVLLERKKFLQLGWNIIYGFNDSDFEVCANRGPASRPPVRFLPRGPPTPRLPWEVPALTVWGGGAGAVHRCPRTCWVSTWRSTRRHPGMLSSTSSQASTTAGTSRMTGTGGCSPPTSTSISVTRLCQPPSTGEGEVVPNGGGGGGQGAAGRPCGGTGVTGSVGGGARRLGGERAQGAG